jgi:uncharacterized pyridoxamine 5'-phosphate oxidase family protein
MSKYDKYPAGKEVTYHTVRNGKLEVRTGIIKELFTVFKAVELKVYLMTNNDRALFSEIEKGNVRHERRKL